MTVGSGSGWLEGDGVSEFLELGDESFGRAFGVAALEVVPAEFAVGLAGGEHVPVGGQHRVFDGPESASVPDSWPESLVLSLEVGAFGAGRGERGFFERDSEPLRAFAGPSGSAFPGGFVVP